MRPSGRASAEMRAVTLTRHFTRHAEGSVLSEFGHTRVLCTASVEERVPGFLKGKGRGWVTAEYGMLPRATGDRSCAQQPKRCRPPPAARRRHEVGDLPLVLLHGDVRGPGAAL